MKDLMIDIETLGTKPGTVILSISAVWFHIETGALGKEFNVHVDVNNSVNQGLHVDVDTFLWWMKQDYKARKLAFCKDGKNLSDALVAFEQFFLDSKNVDTKVWANSPSFDFRLLEFAFEIVGFCLPWEYYNERDVRTLASFYPEIKNETKFEGIPHNGIDDCNHQIKYCSEIYQKLNITPKTNTHD